MSDMVSTSSGWSGTFFDKNFQFQLLRHLRFSEELLDRASKILDLADFDLPICQILWEALFTYWTTYHELPTNDTLERMILKINDNHHGEFRSLLVPEERAGLANLMAFVHNPAGSELTVGFFKNELPNFIRWVRSAKLIGREQESLVNGQAPSLPTLMTELEVLHRMGLAEDEESGFTTLQTDDGMMPTPDDSCRVSLGCTRLNLMYDGGAKPGDLCMVTACTGVGKTVALLNFCLSGVYDGHRGLFLSLELRGSGKGNQICSRFAAMAGCIAGETIKRPMTTWTKEERARLAAAKHPDNPVSSLATFKDCSKRAIELRDIDRIIGEWKQHVVEIDGDDERCRVVCVDYLDSINFPLSKTGSEWNQRDDYMKEFKRIAERHGVVIWTAAQGNRDALKKSVLDLGDTAGGLHKHNSMDISISLALPREERLSSARYEEALEENPDAILQGSDFRTLVVGTLKYREGNDKVLSVVQGPNLRLYDTRSDYARHDHAVGELVERKYDGRDMYKAGALSGSVVIDVVEEQNLLGAP